jgi:hypothetical protein
MKLINEIEVEIILHIFLHIALGNEILRIHFMKKKERLLRSPSE